MNRYRFATLALAATLASSACGADAPPLCEQDLCITSSTRERVDARFDLAGTAGTATLEVTDTAVDVTIAAGERVLLRSVGARGASHYENQMFLDGLSVDAALGLANAGDPSGLHELATFQASPEGAVVRQVLERLQLVLEPRDLTAELGDLAGVYLLMLDQVDAFTVGGDADYSPPSNGSCLFCIYFDKGCMCSWCHIEGS